jgi:hypothetical protein
MPTNTAHQNDFPQRTPDALRNWIMVVLTSIFVAHCGAALIGWLKPLADEKVVLGLEPIIFRNHRILLWQATGSTE